MFFIAPTGIALIPLALLAANPQGLGSVWRDPATPSASLSSNLAEVLAGRSPGTRDPNALYSIKPERVAVLSKLADILPHERVLSVVRDRPGLGLDDPDPSAFGIADPIAALFPDSPLSFGVPGLTIPNLATGIPGGGGGGGGGAPGSGGGGSSGGNSGTLVPIIPAEAAQVTPPATGVEVTSPVPEPSTWLTSIVGFFAVAGVLRRRGRVAHTMAPGRA